jgi:flagellar basal-body rod protein FlgC
MTALYSISGSALLAERRRLNLVASNIANANSTTSSDGQPYRARFATFAAYPMDEAGNRGVRVSNVIESQAPFKQIYDPGNPQADAQGYVKGSNVSIVRQMSDLINCTQTYRANLAMLQQDQQLDRSMIQAL